MIQICSPTFFFAFLVVIQSVFSQLEGNTFELQFTAPEVTRKFSDAVSWCKTNNNSTLAVINDTKTQMALAQFLDFLHFAPELMYIDVQLFQSPIDTWFLTSGSQYNGAVGNQEPNGTHYLMYCRLRYNIDAFILEASAPSDFRHPICDFEESMCSIDSADNIRFNQRCYVKYENENLTWFQAKEKCISIGGNLAEFQQDAGKYSPPFSTAWLNQSFTYWIGIRYKNLSWMSSENDQETIYAAWLNGKPNNYDYRCACADPNGSPRWSWTDCDCTQERHFVCLKKVAVQTTTLMTTTRITTTMYPTTTAWPITTTTNPITGPIDNNPTTTAQQSSILRIALGAGIGGGCGLILLVALIIVLIFIIRRRKRRSKGSDGSTSEMQGVVGDSDKTENNGGVYAAVVPNGKNPGKTTDPRSEIIYTSPEFTKELNSKGHTNSSYEDANLVKDPDEISTFRGQTRSIFPQGFTDLYANADEVPKSID